MTQPDDFRRRRVAAFLQIADEELRAAETLAIALPRQTAFFQQQCVEKLVRAVLEAEAVPAGPTHNLRTLIDLLPVDHALRARFLEFEDLSASATRYRYPSGSGDAPRVSGEQVKKRQSEITRLVREITEHLKPWS